MKMNSDSLKKFSKIAYKCLKNDRKQRPSMGLVVEKLEKALELQERAETWAPNVRSMFLKFMQFLDVHKCRLQMHFSWMVRNLHTLVEMSARNANKRWIVILILLLIMIKKQGFCSDFGYSDFMLGWIFIDISDFVTNLKKYIIVGRYLYVKCVNGHSLFCNFC
ncbi:unnamed protein product [Lactuca virosa]|uniref:Serine-threonine/tyrosine-protein kinase catalytic domain-containing protein n=1 Tax=Lactuca virosa TaxID=75947 RepID=A0AAU9NFV0_9ASTR|nr:unnamed protein product [Lactuca virosa]